MCLLNYFIFKIKCILLLFYAWSKVMSKDPFSLPKLMVSGIYTVLESSPAGSLPSRTALFRTGFKYGM